MSFSRLGAAETVRIPPQPGDLRHISSIFRKRSQPTHKQPCQYE